MGGIGRHTGSTPSSVKILGSLVKVALSSSPINEAYVKLESSSIHVRELLHVDVLLAVVLHAAHDEDVYYFEVVVGYLRDI